jgi:alkylhydroperoxidase family enzyme
MARVPYRSPETFDGDESSLKSAMAREDLPESYRDIYSTELRRVHRALANNPPVLDAFRAYSGTLWRESGLSVRERELVILAVASETGSRYEWHQHVRHGLVAGLDESEIRAIGASQIEPFEDREAALVSYARAVAAQEVDDALQEALEQYVSDYTVVGIGALAAAYIGLAHLLDALAVTPEEPFVGWELDGL